METFERLESQVRSYSRSFPVVFERATGAQVYDTSGRRYIDFFCGAGALNYGHNHPVMKAAVIEYLQHDGMLHSLDMATSAKAKFLELFEATILHPRRMDYKVQFTGPTGANAVEAALKLARKIKRRSNVVAFTNAYHGLSLGALATTANSYYRDEAFTARLNVSFMPFDGYFGKDVDTIEFLRRLLEDKSSGLDLPAAIIVETIQAEGGINVASNSWLRELERLCRAFDILLIVDDIQAGCGRAGTFFSFEPSGIRPDMIVLSKSISGFGFPMSLLLMRPELDIWKPGEHSGTFRGLNLAFITGAEALRFWESEELSDNVQRSGRILQESLNELAQAEPGLNLRLRGRGLIHGLEAPDPRIAQAAAREAFRRGLIVELCGPKHNVLKLLPPLTIEEDLLREGLDLVRESVVFAGTQVEKESVQSIAE